MTQPLWRPVAGKYGRTVSGVRTGRISQIGSDGSCTACVGNVFVIWHESGMAVSATFETSRGDEPTHSPSNLRLFDLTSEWFDDPAPAQPIDVYEVVPGDLLDLRVKVDRIENGRPVVYSAHAPGQARVADAYPQDIIRHMPSRRFIEEGCTVALDGGGRGKVLKVWDGMAWVIRLRNGEPEPCAPRTWPFDRLERIDEEGA